MIYEASGMFPTRELFDSAREILQNLEWTPAGDVLADFRSIAAFLVTPDSISSLLELQQEWKERSKTMRVAVVAKDVSILTFARLYAISNYDSSAMIRVFSDITPAKHWLGLTVCD
jgi:hypothetical protein